MPYTYACAEFPGMEECPGKFTAATQEELWKLMELHGREAHGENPDEYSEDDRRQVQQLIHVS
jgi:predicted small metal-binding protein